MRLGAEKQEQTDIDAADAQIRDELGLGRRRQNLAGLDLHYDACIHDEIGAIETNRTPMKYDLMGDFAAHAESALREHDRQRRTI